MATPMDQNTADQILLFLRQLQQHSMLDHGQTDRPQSNYLSFVPQTLQSNVLLMTARPLQPDKKTTVFLGTIRPNYIPAMWAQDVQQWQQNLGAQHYLEIQLFPLGETPELAQQLNASDAIPKILTALQSLNNLPKGEHIRIICLGTGYSSFLYTALTYLLKEWRNSDGTQRTGKFMQFITSGDTGKRDLSDFCQWLCISGVCESIEFYDTQRYHPFGQCHTEYAHR
jgi:hypothetical protein